MISTSIPDPNLPECCICGAIATKKSDDHLICLSCGNAHLWAKIDRRLKWCRFWGPSSGFVGGIIFGVLIGASIIGFGLFMSRK